ncbi:MAG TPA: hypothetical protein VFA75_22255 [Nevskia sp.]|jgi:hypothetical protein|nr:hypothetical protein [Nevskia sp.]
MEGVIAWQGRMLIYRRDGERWRLRFLGEDGEVAPSPELVAAVEADIRHQEAKLHQAG